MTTETSGTPTSVRRFHMSAYVSRDGRKLVDAIQKDDGGWVMFSDYQAVAALALELATRLGALQKQLEEYFHDD